MASTMSNAAPVLAAAPVQLPAPIQPAASIQYLPAPPATPTIQYHEEVYQSGGVQTPAHEPSRMIGGQAEPEESGLPAVNNLDGILSRHDHLGYSPRLPQLGVTTTTRSSPFGSPTTGLKRNRDAAALDKEVVNAPAPKVARREPASSHYGEREGGGGFQRLDARDVKPERKDGGGFQPLNVYDIKPEPEDEVILRHYEPDPDFQPLDARDIKADPEDRRELPLRVRGNSDSTPARALCLTTEGSEDMYFWNVWHVWF